MVGISSNLWACDELRSALLAVKLEKNHGEAWHSSHSLHTFSNFLLVPQNSLHLPSRLICEYNSTQTLASLQIFQICVSLGHVLYFQSQGYTHQNQIHYKLWVALNLMLSTNDVVFKQEAEKWARECNPNTALSFPHLAPLILPQASCSLCSYGASAGFTQHKIEGISFRPLELKDTLWVTPAKPSGTGERKWLRVKTGPAPRFPNALSELHLSPSLSLT